MRMPWEHQQIGPNGDTPQERLFAKDVQSMFVEKKRDPLAIPDCLKRDKNNVAPYMQVSPATGPQSTPPDWVLPWESK